MEYNAESFLNDETSQPSLRRPPLPVGDYVAVIGKPSVEPWVGKPGTKNAGKTGHRAVISLTVEVPYDVRQALGIDMGSVTLSDSVFLDVDAAGRIDWNTPGKNGGLRRYREALDLNKPNDKFSLAVMEGKPIRVKISHRMWEGEAVEQIDGVARV